MRIIDLKPHKKGAVVWREVVAGANVQNQRPRKYRNLGGWGIPAFVCQVDDKQLLLEQTSAPPISPFSASLLWDTLKSP